MTPVPGGGGSNPESWAQRVDRMKAHRAALADGAEVERTLNAVRNAVSGILVVAALAVAWQHPWWWMVAGIGVVLALHWALAVAQYRLWTRPELERIAREFGDSARGSR